MVGVVLPRLLSFYYNETHNNDFRFTLQYINGFLILGSSLFLVVLNSKQFKLAHAREKFWRIFFLILACLVFFVFTVALYYQFRLRHGIGF